MLQVGDIVKVIAPTMFNGELTELIPVGTYARVVNIDCEEDGSLSYEIRPLNELWCGYCYPENELEKGHFEWVKG